MLSKRIIACLDVRDGQVVKGINFEGLRTAGDPAELARRYNAEGVDELVILDITATLERRRALADTIRAVAGELFIPLAVGGGIRTEADAAAAVDAGADKVSLNTAALSNPSLITTLAERYGSQAVLVAIDAKWEGNRAAVYVRSGSTPGHRDAVEWAKEAEDRSASTARSRRRFQAPCRSRSSHPAAPGRSSTSTKSSPPAAPMRHSRRRSFTTQKRACNRSSSISGNTAYRCASRSPGHQITKC